MTDVPTIFDRVLPLNLVANTVIFFVAARLYFCPWFPPSTTTDSCSDFAFSFNATSRNDVPDSRRNLSRITAGVRLSGGVRRSGDRDHCVFGDPSCVPRLSSCQAIVWISTFSERLICSWRSRWRRFITRYAMGPAYWIPAFWSPLLVTHYVTFVLLRRPGTF